MKQNGFFRIAAVLAAVLIFTAFPAGADAAAAAGSVSAETMVEAPLFTAAQSMKLPHSTASFWFMIPEGTKLGEKNSVTLRMSVTGTLLQDYNSVTLMMNGVSVASTRITDVVKNSGGAWTVPVPEDRLKTDGTLNELRVVTAQRSILGDCADIDNPSNWVNLLESSSLNLDVLQMGDPQLGSVLPYLFNRVDRGNRIGAEFVLPSGADSDTRSAMLTIASAAGAQYPVKDGVSFTVSQGNSSGAEPNRIFLGLGSRLPQGAAAVPALTAGSGYLSATGNGAYSDLLVAGADAAGLAKAAAFFTNPAYLQQLSGTSAVVATDLRNKAAETAKHADGYYALADFGYDTASLAGAFHQQVTYTLNQPDAVRGGPDSYVEIHFRHSEALVADSSLLTVYVDDVPVNSVQLSDSNASGGTIKAKIPAEALGKSALSIKVDCYNYLGKVDCSKDYYDTAWTVVDKNSVVYFQPGNTGLTPTVRQFPIFGGRTDSSARTAILVMPNNASAALLAAGAELACRAGQNTGTAYHWECTDNLSSATDKASSDILIMGGNDSVSIPNEVASLLAAVPHANGTFTVNGAAAVTAEALRNKIAVQAVRSPWNFARKVYVVTYPSAMEAQIGPLVSSRNTLNKLDGILSMIDGSGNVTSVAASDAAGEKIPLTPDRVVGKIVQFTGIPRAGLLVILVCILIILFLIFRAIANRRRFADAKLKMQKINSSAGKYASKGGWPPPAGGTGNEGQPPHNAT